MGAKHQVQFNFEVRDKPLPPFRRFILSNVERDDGHGEYVMVSEMPRL